MTVNINLKPQVDTPIFEWCKFAPTSTTAISSLTTGNSIGNRYLYYQVSSVLYRYDTYTDSWNRCANTIINTPTIMNCNVLSNAVGHYGRAISAGSGDNTIQIAAPPGNMLVGYKIRILSGTGAGQEKTITEVAAPVIAERGTVTTGGASSSTDATTGVGLKQWKINQWRDYQFRADFGTGRMQYRPILYNSINNVAYSDVAQFPVNPWANPLLSTATAANTLYVIESSIVTVDTNWTIKPDNTSKFVILGGGIWNITQGTTGAPYYTFVYYDILTDTWYGKPNVTNLKTIVFIADTDLSMERMTEAGGAIASGTLTAGAARSVTMSGGLTPMAYANFEIRLTSVSGVMGQSRSILSNTSNTINITRDWDVTPASGVAYEIWRDTGKVWISGGGDAGLLQYSIESNQMTTGKQFDFGTCRQLSAKRSGQEPYALTSITRTAGSIISLDPVPTVSGSGYNIDDILTITTGGTGGTARVTAVASNGGVQTVALETVGTTYTSGTGKATTVAPAGGSNTCTLNITAVDFSELAVSAISHDFMIGDSVLIAGASGTGMAKFNGTYTILGVPSVTQFSYCSVGDPGAATATIAVSPTTNQLVDCTKNWAVNEHAGKLVQLATNAVVSVGQVRRILSNTPTVLVWTLAATAPVNGTSLYVIQDCKAFGSEITNLGRRGGGIEGFATGGSTTTLTDTTKNWQTNAWSRTAQRKVRIVEGTGVGSELAITSNTSNTLTYATQTFTPDTTTRYVIMDSFGTATAGAVTTLTDSSQNWDVNGWTNKRVRFMSGTSQGNEYTITSNTATVLTFATGTAPDVSTAYTILESSVRTYGHHLDCITGCTDPTFNNKYFYVFTGSATAELMRYNINTEHWEFLPYFPQMETNTTGAMYVYDGQDRIYINLSTSLGMTGRLVYYDIPHNTIHNATTVPYGHGTAIIGNRMEIVQTVDGLKYLYVMRHSAQEMWRTLLWF